MPRSADSRQEAGKAGKFVQAEGVFDPNEKRRKNRRRGPNRSPAKCERDRIRAIEHQQTQEFQQHVPLHPLGRVPEQESHGNALLEDIPQAVEKRLERQRHRERLELAAEASSIEMEADTKQRGDAIKAERLQLAIGGHQVLINANVVISEKVKAYGLVGPNGCGKTTLLRLLAGEFGKPPEAALPIPRSWDVHLVDQLDPAPTGRSPVEEVLSSHKERSSCMAELEEVLEQLRRYDGKTLEAEDESCLQKLNSRHEDVSEQLARWDSSEREVRGILAALGFSADGGGADGEPCMDRKDEFVTSPACLELGATVEVRDSPDEAWQRGVVTTLAPLEVQPEGWDCGYRWNELRHAHQLSGGWRKKVALAKALWLKPKLLLLDEPTNHLDFGARIWLEDRLQEYPHTVILVSHDPCFMSNVCDKILHIKEQRVETLEMKKVSIGSLMGMQCIERSRPWRFAFPPALAMRGKRSQKALRGLSFHQVSFQYEGAAAPALRDVAIRFSERSRVAVVGRNGSGKTTLLNLCLSMLEPTTGEVHADCTIGHFSQHFNEALDKEPDPVASQSAMSYLVSHCRVELQQRFGHSSDKKLREAACSILNTFGLELPVSTLTAVRDLSGGQKARLNFAFLSLKPCELLVLDEPTNHLDAEGLHHLSEAIRSFQGGVVLASHDEYLIESLLNSRSDDELDDQLLFCKDGSVQCLPVMQGLQQYRGTVLNEQFQREQAAQRDLPRRKRQTFRKPQSEASTREPTPEPPQPAAKVHAVQDIFKKPGKKFKSCNLNKTGGAAT